MPGFHSHVEFTISVWRGARRGEIITSVWRAAHRGEITISVWGVAHCDKRKVVGEHGVCGGCPLVIGVVRGDAPAHHHTRVHVEPPAIRI